MLGGVGREGEGTGWSGCELKSGEEPGGNRSARRVFTIDRVSVGVMTLLQVGV